MHSICSYGFFPETVTVTGYNGSVVFVNEYIANDEGECELNGERILTEREIAHIMKDVDGKNHTVYYQQDEEEEPLSIASVIDKSGMNMKEFANHFGIPYRTVQDWKNGNSRCADYILKLLDHAVEEI